MALAFIMLTVVATLIGLLLVIVNRDTNELIKKRRFEAVAKGAQRRQRPQEAPTYSAAALASGGGTSNDLEYQSNGRMN